MTEPEIIEQLRTFILESAPLNTLMQSLPERTEVRVHVAGRYNGVISYQDSSVHFYSDPVSEPEFDLSISTEAIRRIVNAAPNTLAQLLEEMARETLAGNLVWKINIGPKRLWERGHVLTAKRLYPHIQAELLQKLLIALGVVNTAFEAAKERLKGVLK